MCASRSLLPLCLAMPRPPRAPWHPPGCCGAGVSPSGAVPASLGSGPHSWPCWGRPLGLPPSLLHLPGGAHPTLKAARCLGCAARLKSQVGGFRSGRCQQEGGMQTIGADPPLAPGLVEGHRRAGQARGQLSAAHSPDAGALPRLQQRPYHGPSPLRLPGHLHVAQWWGRDQPQLSAAVWERVSSTGVPCPPALCAAVMLRCFRVLPFLFRGRAIATGGAALAPASSLQPSAGPDVGLRAPEGRR